MAQSAMGIDLLDVTDEAQLPLGFIYREPADKDNDGEREWVYIKTDDALGVGEVAVRKDGTATHTAIIAATGTLYPSVRVLGVAQHTIGAGQFGFVLRRGTGVIRAGTGAGLTADTGVVTGGAGTGRGLIYARSTDGHDGSLIGFAFETVAANATASAWVNVAGS